ncbi:type VI secretion system-associated protein TagF [Stigmatella sp. ncwal1]|uniref:Type VI secretion system-associated protein TagF n=1 Tax=Stigmatella ashevillensis TaxID=2995309 RepID=A0ABT5DBW0_9BACT|nr:type VI secretion system-associated protein TagF [Stigmatella ashevillena]MDC0711164.1 type VI secretion system-associated protein TagF [Stigmatella ashevillena]
MRVRAAATRTGVVGKAPFHADFIRINAASALSLQLHRWLTEGVEAAHAERCDLPSGVVSFLFTAPKEQNVLLGVLAPSMDGVGRQFPLAVFAELSAPAVADRLAPLLTACRPFLSEGAALLRAAPGMDLETLTRAVRELPLPRPEELAAAERYLQRQWAERRGKELLEPLGPPDELPGGFYYALHTFLLACTGERDRQQAAANVILECPLNPALGPGVWLELAARLLRWPSMPPAFAWSEEGQRLLLCLGATVPELFLLLARPGRGSSRLWPLRTSLASAIERARRSLSGTQLRLIDSPTASLEELLHALSW